MTDKEWLAKMKQCKKRLDQHQKLLQEIAEEYRERYGEYPSEVDDDFFIDTFHYSHGDVNLEKIKENAEIRKTN